MLFAMSSQIYQKASGENTELVSVDLARSNHLRDTASNKTLLLISTLTEERHLNSVQQSLAVQESHDYAASSVSFALIWPGRY